MGNTSHSKRTAFRSGFAQQQIKEAAPFLSKNSLPFIQAERFPVFKPGRTHNYHAPQYRVFLGEGQPSAKLLNGQQSSYKRTGFMVVLPTEERIPEKWVGAGGKVRRPPCSGYKNTRGISFSLKDMVRDEFLHIDPHKTLHKSLSGRSILTEKQARRW